MACLLAVLSLAWPASSGASGERPAPPRIPARAWIVVDADDGTRLADDDPSVSLPMASTAKLMTAYLARRDLPLGKVLVAPPYHAIRGESLMGLRAGERVSVRDLLYGLLLPSGNDAAAALAVGDAGSIPAFVDEMNDAARRLGLRDTSYANPIGLDAASEYSSPRDLAALTLRLRRDPVFRRIVETPRKTLGTAHPPTVVNRNVLLSRAGWINGVKTGYTARAGNVLVASGTRKGVTLVSVVMGAPTEAARDDDTLSLLRYGFSLYRRETPVRTGARLRVARVPNGEHPLPLVAARPVTATVRRGQRVEVRVHAPRSVAAPVQRGDRLGSAIVAVGGSLAGRAPLVAGRTVSVAATPLIARVDDALPGPRAATWALLCAAGAVIVIGIALVAARSRRE